MRLMKALAVAMVLAVMFGACKKSSPAAPTPTAQTITITGTLSFANRSETSQLTANAAMSDGATVNVTATATWTSGNAAVASVNSGGLVTALTNGTTVITAAYQGKSQTAVVTVAMKATPQLTQVFKRLCNPFRAGLDLTFTEASGNIGMSVTSVTVTMKLFGVTKFNRAYSGAEIAALTSGGSNHLDAGQTRVMSIIAAYTGNVETEDSTADVLITFTDDAGNTSFINKTNINQQDWC